MTSGTHERGHLEPAQAARREHCDQPHLLGRWGSPRARSGTRPAGRPRGSGPMTAARSRPTARTYSDLTTPTSITRRSWVPTPIVRSPSLTSTSKRSLRPSATSRSRGADRAARFPRRRGDVLDADLEADRRPSLGQVLEGEDGRGPLHHRDHPGGREDADADRAADVGDEPVLDLELVGSLDSRAKLVRLGRSSPGPRGRDASRGRRSPSAAGTRPSPGHRRRRASRRSRRRRRRRPGRRLRPRPPRAPRAGAAGWPAASSR